MKVKNLTKESQTLWIRDLLTGGSVPVEVLPNEPREIAKNYMPDEARTPNFHNLFEVITGYKKPEEQKEVEAEETTTEAPAEVPETPGVEEEESTAEATTEPEANESKFICDLCGAEFGSAQGLKMHKTRAHSSES